MQSETEAKPKVTRGRRGRKATRKTKRASPSDQDTDASEVDETKPVEEEKVLKSNAFKLSRQNVKKKNIMISKIG